MDSPDVLERMRSDWNERAGEDANYYVAFGRKQQEDEEFYATASDVVRDLEHDLKRFPGRDAALEIGCGPGRLMRPLSRHFHAIHGVDVSDEMIRLAEKYVDRPAAELPLLFQRILSNATMDWFRRQKVRNAVMYNLSDFESPEGDDFDLLETLEAADGMLGSESAADSVGRAQILLLIEAEVAQLPTRQREAFLLRYWEELDVAETAAVMGCSEGSVKTHCSRAVHALAKALQAKGVAP